MHGAFGLVLFRMRPNDRGSFEGRFSFFQQPAAQEEREVAEVMERYHEALERRDAELLLSLFSSDARIQSVAAGGIVGVADYETALRSSLPFTGRISIVDLVVEATDRDAVVHGFSQYFYKGRMGKAYKRVWRLKKDSGRWLIVESRYLDHG